MELLSNFSPSISSERYIRRHSFDHIVRPCIGLARFDIIITYLQLRVSEI